MQDEYIPKEIKVDASPVDVVDAPFQNFGLHQSEFHEMVILLKQGHEDLFEKVFLSHFENCIEYLINHYKCGREIAYDLTMDTMIEFRHKLIQNKINYGNLRYLFTKMASQLYLKSINKENKLKEILWAEGVEEEYHEQRFHSLDTAWQALDEDEKKLLQSYYYDDLAFKEIASMHNINEANLRKKKQRAMDKLRKIFFSVYNI